MTASLILLDILALDWFSNMPVIQWHGSLNNLKTGHVYWLAYNFSVFMIYFQHLVCIILKNCCAVPTHCAVDDYTSIMALKRELQTQHLDIWCQFVRRRQQNGVEKGRIQLLCGKGWESESRGCCASQGVMW